MAVERNYEIVQTCPICMNSATVEIPPGVKVFEITCPKCGIFLLDRTVLNSELKFRYKLRSCLYYYLTHQTRSLKEKNIFPFFYEDDDEEEGIITPYFGVQKKSISVSSILQIYPKDIHEKTAMIMVNLSHLSGFIGNDIFYDEDEDELDYLFFADEYFGITTIKDQINGIIDFLERQDLLAGMDEYNSYYRITPQGWALIDKHQKEYATLPQCFIAMWFDPSIEKAKTKIIEAIRACGYMPMVIDMKEHNNQIVPEIFFEIKRSEFVVADLTGNRGGVYYEAGYAEALGKQVIICCRSDQLDDMHFDVKQKSAILWDTEDDLAEKLYKRIEATIGIRKQP